MSYQRLIFAMSLAVNFGLWSQQNADAVTWEHKYEGDVLPSAFSPAFALQEGGGSNGTTTLNGGGWVEVAHTANTYYQWDMNAPNWKVGTSGSTIEFRMAVSEIAATFGTSFQVTDDTLGKVWFFGWTHNNIFMDGGNQGQPVFDVNEFNIYRFTFATDGTANLYLNNDPTPRLTGSGGSLNGLTNFSFGDLSSVLVAGTGSYDYIYWTTAGAFAPESPTVPGDFDGDGDVDGADFVVWQTNFPTSTGATLDTGDADGDGDVDGADFVVWQTHFPTTPSQIVSAVPEPCAFILCAFAAVVACFPQFRRL